MATREEDIAIYLNRIAPRIDLHEMVNRSAAQATEESAEKATSKKIRDDHAAASAGVQQINSGRVPTREQAAGIEAIILPKIRPVLDIVDGDFHTDHPLWQ